MLSGTFIIIVLIFHEHLQPRLASPQNPSKRIVWQALRECLATIQNPYPAAHCPQMAMPTSHPWPLPSRKVSHHLVPKRERSGFSTETPTPPQRRLSQPQMCGDHNARLLFIRKLFMALLHTGRAAFPMHHDPLVVWGTTTSLLHGWDRLNLDESPQTGQPNGTASVGGSTISSDGNDQNTISFAFTGDSKLAFLFIYK